MYKAKFLAWRHTNSKYMPRRSGHQYNNNDKTITIIILTQHNNNNNNNNNIIHTL